MVEEGNVSYTMYKGGIVREVEMSGEYIGVEYIQGNVRIPSL